MSQTGSVWAGLLGLQTARFDLLEVYSSEQSKYINVAAQIDALVLAVDDLKSASTSDTTRLDAIEAKLTALDEQKATKFVALDPLILDEGVFPNELYQGGGPTPASASSINFNGVDAYFSFPNGRGNLLDFTKDWSIGFSVKVQGESVQGANLATFGSGGVSLMLKVQGEPLAASNWGSYNTSAGDLYHVATRFNANTWAAPVDDTRLLYVYNATEKKLAYYISYEDGSYTRKANISVPQTAIDGQTPGAELSFSSAWSGTGGSAFSGTAYQGVLADWALSPHAWTEVEIQEYFSVGPDQLSSLNVWDKITSFIAPGEYPAVIDTKGVLTDGVFYNGSPDDFIA